MSFWDFTRSPASVRLLVEFGQERGLDSPALLARSGISPVQLADPNAEVSAAQELAVTGNLLRLLKHPAGLGLQVGARYHFSTYGVWGYGLISSATAGDALALALRFLPLTFAFSAIRRYEEENQIVLSFEPPELEPAMADFLVERDMAAAVVLMQEVIGSDFVLSRFCFRAGHRKPLRQQGNIAGVQLQYGAPANTIAFQRGFLTRVLPQANPITVAMCEQMCAQLLERRRAHAKKTAVIKQYLSAVSHDGKPSLAHLARVANTSQRTLRRRLKEEGTSFRALRKESRGALAKELLKDESLSLTAIAERLGFADLSSFSQAFKRWYGIAPSTFRGNAAKPK